MMEFTNPDHLREMGDVMEKARQLIAIRQQGESRAKSAKHDCGAEAKAGSKRRSTKEERRRSRLQIVEAYLKHYYDDGHDLRYESLSRKIQVRECLDDANGEQRDARSGQRDAFSGQRDATNGLRRCYWRDLTDRDLNTIACRCSELEGDNICVQDVRTVLGSEFVVEVHALRDWLEHLPVFDGQSDPIDDLAKQVVVDGDQELWRRCLKKWLVGVVAGWMDGKDVNQYVLTLIGRQGLYKTTWLTRLMPPELRNYCGKMTLGYELTKDDLLRLAEFGIIIFDELDALGRREMNKLKSYITLEDVNERGAYAHTKERRERCASCCACGNDESCLTDTTGNRRWWPFTVQSIQNPWETVLDYEAIYAQALSLYRSGFAHWVERDEATEMEAHTEQFRAKSAEEELLLRCFSTATANTPNARFMTATEMREVLRVQSNADLAMPLSQFGSLLKRMGFEKRTFNRHSKGYLVVRRENLDQIMAEEAIQIQQNLHD